MAPTATDMIETVQDQERGCGWRKPGGLYLISGGAGKPCGKLPLPLHICPTCGQGIKPSRSWTWVSPAALFNERECRNDEVAQKHHGASPCGACPLKQVPVKQRMGLLWIGGSFYPTPGHWLAEAKKMGISRRIQSVPKGFTLGQDWVAVAHREAVDGGQCTECDGSGWAEKSDTLPREMWTPCKECGTKGRTMDPAIFHIFKPERIEYVVTGDEKVKDLEALRKRGITPVRVERVES